MVDRRQFVISNHALSYKDFERTDIGFCHVAYHNELKIQRCFDKQNTEWLLLGEAYCVDAFGKTPLDDIRLTPTDSVADKAFYWTGRWMVIGNGSIYTDAAGLMAMHYYQENGQWFVSPSLHVLSALIKPTPGVIDKTVLTHDAIHAYPAPLTRLNGAKKAFPSQRLLLSRDGVAPEYYAKFRMEFDASRNEKVERVAQYLSNAIRNVAQFSNKKILLALTGGYDSRVLLATLLSTDVPFGAFTMEHTLIQKGDRALPAQMAQKFGFSYDYIKKKTKPQADRLIAYDTHTLYSIAEADRQFYACGQVDKIGENSVVLKGGLLDLCRGSRYSNVYSAAELVAHITSVSPTTAQYQRYREAFEMWVKWTNEHPDAMDIRDRFNIEMYLGGWLSNLQQSADLLDGVYMQIANSAAIVSLICSFSEEERKSHVVYGELFDRLFPEVKKFPVNPNDRLRMLRYYPHTIMANPKMVVKKALRRA